MIYSYSLELTRKANDIFDGCVKKAYIKLKDISDIEDREELIHAVESNCYTFSELSNQNKKDVIELEGETIALEFFNNATVEFQVSEWLTIRSIKVLDKDTNQGVGSNFSPEEEEAANRINFNNLN